jgi:LCP family protein required for cell wall assembly
MNLRDTPFSIVTSIFFLLLTSACSLSGQGEPTPTLIFPTPWDLFGSPNPDSRAPQQEPTKTPTPYPTPTAVDWPEPYLGTPNPVKITPVPPPAPVQHNPEDFNILLLGSDRREIAFSTDVMLLVNFQPKNNTITLLSIPRTMIVYIPGWEMELVNQAYHHGEQGYYPGLGPALVRDTLLYNFGIEVDRYILVDFGQFEEIINTIGGVDVPVACPYTDYRLISPELDPNKEHNWGLYTVPSGVVKMDGEMALWYARSRLKSSDFDRNRRQHEVIRAIADKAISLEMIKYVPALYNQVSEFVVTDLTIFDAITLAPQIADLGSANIRSYYIDQRILTRWYSPSGRVMFIPDLNAMYALVEEALSPPEDTEHERKAYTVEVWNGTTNEGLDRLAAERLNYAGFVSHLGDADKTSYHQTLLYDFTSGGSPEFLQELMDLFGLAPGNTASVPAEDTPYDFLLILGTDFDPCFDPKQIDR